MQKNALQRTRRQYNRKRNAGEQGQLLRILDNTGLSIEFTGLEEGDIQLHSTQQKAVNDSGQHDWMGDSHSFSHRVRPDKKKDKASYVNRMRNKNK